VRPEVGEAIAALDRLAQPLVLAAAHLGQARPARVERRAVVQVDGEVERVRELLRETARQLDHLLHRGVAKGHEGDDVGGTHPGMTAGVRRHVDQLDRLGGAGERARADGVGRPDDRRVEPVVLGVRLTVGEPDARDPREGVADRVDRVGAAPLAEVRHADDEGVRVHRRDSLSAAIVARVLRRP
jgi:hypothetical protein